MADTFNIFRFLSDLVPSIRLPEGSSRWLSVFTPFIIIIISSFMYSVDFLGYAASSSFKYFTHDVGIETYDFIVDRFALAKFSANSLIVGGGSAGAVVAARLSEDPRYKILLLEAGGDPHPLSTVPLLSYNLANQPFIDWQYETEPQENAAFGYDNQKMPYPRGKSLGGTTNENYMIYMRGNPNDYDNWARHTGDQRWEYKNVQRLFRKLEDYHGNWKNNGLLGMGGPLRVEKLGFDPLMPQWLQAGNELGFETIDVNGFQRQGFSPVDVTQSRGRRFGTYKAYIKPNLGRSNLKIYRYAWATKIHLNASHHAVGVDYIRHGAHKFSAATKEVILSGGTINSPQLLMLSGIGPRTHLHSKGVTPLVDLPVGKNFQDHVGVILGPFTIEEPLSFLVPRDLTLRTLAEYALLGTGPLSSPTGAAGTAFVSSKVKGSLGENESWPDIQIFMAPFGVYSNAAKGTEEVLKLKEGFFQKIAESSIGKDSVFLFINVSRPKSRGEIKLKSSDPFQKPSIDPKYYTDPSNTDIKVIVQAIQFGLHLMENTTSFRSIGAKLTEYRLPECAHETYRSFNYWECYARQFTVPIYHAAGTCSMGKPTDPTSVLNSELKVIGVKGLRVADASIMPFIINANTNAASIMIGEMAAELIWKQWTNNNHLY